MIICWNPGPTGLRLEIPEDGPVRLLGVGPEPGPQPAQEGGRQPAQGAGLHSAAAPVRLVEIALSADGHVVPTHAAHADYLTSQRLRHVSHEATDDELTVVQEDPRTGLRVTVLVKATASGRVIHQQTVITNGGSAPQTLAYVSSAAITGVLHDEAGWRDARAHIGYNAWSGEFRWRALSLEDVGLVNAGYPGSTGLNARFAQTGRGSWSSGDALPMGGPSRADGVSWAWQVENNGPWHWEISAQEPDLVVRMSGPTRDEHSWCWELEPGAQYSTAPVAIACSADGFEDALRALTEHRRAIRRPNADDENLPVIFNDYMNALMGDPTTQREHTLIEAAAQAGAEYYVVDCGWYTDEKDWWDLVGDWQESPRRFPGGLREVMDDVRAHGMVPGLWLEPEVIGKRSAAARTLPEDAFFHRDDTRIVEKDRFQLDLRHPAAIAHLDAAIDRIVDVYGVGYLKFDHNINAAPGTGERVGEAMDGHTRALSEWLDSLLERHPDLVIENCSSGGMRVDYAQLSRLSIQSTSDQQSPLLTAAIAAAAPSAVAPEQAAVWAYPQPGMSRGLLEFTLVNALMQRIHLSGHLDDVHPEQARIVADAVTAYKQIRHLIPASLPSWPLGLPGWYDDVLALALDGPAGELASVWNRGDDAARLQLPLRSRGAAEVRQVFPAGAVEHHWDEAGVLTVTMPAGPSAVVLKVSPAQRLRHQGHIPACGQAWGTGG